MRANIGIGLPSNLSPTLTQRALAILRTYGTDAHLWLPGVGVVNGITAGNFSDTAGTTPAVVGSTAGVGLVVDAGGGTINATQGTTAAKPILRQSSGRYSWQFDGTDDRLQLSAVPFQASDDLCVVAAAQCNELAATGRTAFGCSGDGVQRAGMLYCDNGYWRFRFANDAGTPQEIASTVQLPAGTLRVVSGRKVGNNRVLRMNGSQQAADSTAVGTTTLTNAAIGSRSSTGLLPFLGNIGPVIAIKGTVSDADLLTLEKWVGSLSGVTI